MKTKNNYRVLQPNYVLFLHGKDLTQCTTMELICMLYSIQNTKDLLLQTSVKKHIKLKDKNKQGKPQVSFILEYSYYFLNSTKYIQHFKTERISKSISYYNIFIVLITLTLTQLHHHFFSKTNQCFVTKSNFYAK